MSRGGRLLPLLIAALALAVLAWVLSNIVGPRAYPTRLLLLGSVVISIAFLYLGRREIAFIFLKARRVSEPGPATTWMLIGLVMIAASLVAGRAPMRMDLTSRGLNRLSGASRTVLASLQMPVEMIGVFRETSPQRDRGIDVLAIYRNESTHITTRMLDPDRQPDDARRLNLTRSGVIVVRAGEVKEEVGELTEEALTQAILRVEYPRRTRVAFLTGHGERAIGDVSALGIGRFAADLRETGYEVIEISLLDAEIPRDVAALAMVGPSRALLPGELKKLGNYLDGGGRLLLCVDPGSDAGMGDLLRTHGIVLDSLEVYDEGGATRSLGMGPRTIVVSEYPKHPIIAGGMGYTVFSGVRHIGVTQDPVWGIDQKVILWTGRQARLARLDGKAPGEDQKPEMRSVGVAEQWEVPGSGTPSTGQSAPEKPYARIAVIGDSDWLDGQFIELFANRELAIRTMHWLTEREFLLRIPPIDMRGTPLRIGLSGLKSLFYLLEIATPLALLGIALRLWSRRR